jgi:hypothetical protein
LSNAKGFDLCYHPAKRIHAIFSEPAMETNLRPMSLGEILDRTALLYRGNFLLFTGIAAVYAGILLILNLGQIGMNEALLHLHMTKQIPLFSLAYIVIIVPITFVCAGASIAANNRAVAWVNLGQPATITGAYRSIFPRMGRYLWLMTIVGFIIYFPFVILAGGYTLFLFLYGWNRGLFAAGSHTNPEAAAVVLVVSGVFFLLCLAYLVYAILMGLRYSLAVPACVVEDIKARKAIRRSIELSQGSRGRIFLLGLLILAIQLGLVFVTQIIFIVAIFAAAKKGAQPPVWIQIAQQIVGFLTNSFIGPMYATGLTLFYYDQRIRKEGFDIEWMMEAAGMSAQPAPVAPPYVPIESLPAHGEEPAGPVESPESASVTESATAPATDPAEPPENPHG